MPEGPEIRRAADGLMQAMSHLPITLAWFAFPHLKRWETQLTGQTIDKIEARGKALLTWFSNGLVLYSHNQLYGVWRVVKAGGNAGDETRPASTAGESQRRHLALQRIRNQYLKR